MRQRSSVRCASFVRHRGVVASVHLLPTRRPTGHRLFVWQQVGERDRLVAMGARTAGANAASELMAVVAPLLAQVARAARGTLVDRRQSRRTGRQRRGRRWVVAAPGRLPAGVGAEAAPPGRTEHPPARVAGHRNAIVTPRVFSHRSPSCTGQGRRGPGASRSLARRSSWWMVRSCHATPPLERGSRRWSNRGGRRLSGAEPLPRRGGWACRHRTRG